MLTRTRTEEPCTAKGVPKRHPQSVRHHLGRLRSPSIRIANSSPPIRARCPSARRRSLESCTHGAQQFVARGVAELIVDLLEVVEVDEDEDEPAVAHHGSSRWANNSRLGSPVRES